MPSRRQQRVSNQLVKTLSELISHDVKDPRIEGITVTDVAIDRELEVANVYVNSLRGESARDETLRALSGAAGFIRRELGTRIRLQNTPELRFHWDETLAEADKIERLLASIDIPPVTDHGEAPDEGD